MKKSFAPAQQTHLLNRRRVVDGVSIKKKLYSLDYGLFSKNQIFKKNKKAIQSFKKTRYLNHYVYFGEIGRKIGQSKTGKFFITPSKKFSGFKTIIRTSNQNIKKSSRLFNTKTWYMDKAAPIPGGNNKLSTGFSKKNKFYKKIFCSYRDFKRYYNLGQKTFVKQYRKTNYSFHLPVRKADECGTDPSIYPLCGPLCGGADHRGLEFSVLMQVDSLFHSSMRKSRLVPNWSAQSSLKEFTKYYLLNGNYVQKKNFRLFKRNKRANKDGYFCIRRNF